MEQLNIEINDESKKTMSMLADIEEQWSCSGGICPGENNTSTFLPIYIFSNVNNGVPKESCHKHIAAVITGRVDMYLLGFIICTSISLLTVVCYLLVVMYRGCKSVKNYCDK
jgi:hypothetical protein